MIKIENLVHKYTIWKDENTKSEKTVLDGISLDIPSGQFVAILGPKEREVCAFFFCFL